MSQKLRPDSDVLVTEWKSPGTCANVDRDGESNWSNVDNCKLQNDIYTMDGIDPGHYNDWLRCTNFGFTTNDIPIDATVIGIELGIDGHSVGGAGIKDSALYLRKTASQVGDNKASATLWATSDTDTYILYGGASDLWNSGLTGADIRDSGFGIDLSIYNDAAGVRAGYVDHIKIRIHWIKKGSWEPEPSDTTLWNTMDESEANDSDYAWHDAVAGNEYFQVSLSNPSGTPGSGTGTIRWRISRIDGAKITKMTAYLYELGTLRFTGTEYEITDSFVTREETVDAGSMASITDWNSLSLMFKVTTVSGGGKASDPAISWVEFEVPDPSGAPVYRQRIIGPF